MIMNRFLFKLSGLLAAAMLIAQVPVCLCSEAAHSHNAAEVSPCCRHDVARHEHHRDGDSHDSHQPASEGQRGPCPASCQCVSQDLQAGIIPNAVTTDTKDRQFLTWLSQTTGLLPALPSSAEGLGHHPIPAGSVLDAGAFAQGNPCALLCRWLC